MAEADLPEGKATAGAGGDLEMSRRLEALSDLSPNELHGSAAIYSFAPSLIVFRSFATVGLARRPAANWPHSRKHGDPMRKYPLRAPRESERVPAWCVNGTAAHIPSPWRRRGSPTPDGTTARSPRSPAKLLAPAGRARASSD